MSMTQTPGPMPVLPQHLNPQEGIISFPFEFFGDDHPVWKQHMAGAIQVFGKRPHDDLLRISAPQFLRSSRGKGNVNVFRRPDVVDTADG